MLVMQLAQQLDHEILDRGQPVRATELVDHGGHVRMALAHLEQQVEHPHRRRHHRHRPHHLRQLKASTVAPERQQILDVHEPDHVIERIAKNQQPGMPRGAHRGHDLGQARGYLDGTDIGARHHHVVDTKLAEAQGVEQELALVGGELLDAAAGLLLLEQILERLAQAAIAALARRQLLQPAQQAFEHGRAGSGLAGKLPHRPASRTRLGEAALATAPASSSGVS